ncbi:winged helix-turn-helix transcriptional regulator [Aeromicrobium sp.]|uniref:winged helix-turn-helix transcriptional regulator n=1 Tax=Aeromicrobium sp. TaxID=1871063 RepID=UPI002FC8648D
MTDPPDWNVFVRTCPSRTSLAEIANKWTAMIVIVLEPGPLRFTEIRAAVDGISGKVLSETLRRLERDGLVERRSYDRMPPHVEYELTPLGHSLQAPLDALRVWAEAHIEKVLDAREGYDDRMARR